MVTLAPLFVTMVTPPGNGDPPIVSILGMLSTSPIFSQLNGGTKNKL